MKILKLVIFNPTKIIVTVTKLITLILLVTRVDDVGRGIHRLAE